jgi:type I restriction enzyme, S subunit
MIVDLRPYSEYKDSNVAWLGDVPRTWEIRRIKTMFRERDERSGDGQGLLLSLTRARGIVPQAEASNRIASASDLSKYRLCRSGNLVMNRMQAWAGMFAVSPLEGLVSPDYSVFTAISSINARFYEQLFKTPNMVEQFAQASKGVGSGFNRLYTPDFGAIQAVVPPFAEQSAIVRFLDHADRRVRRFIAAKRKLIALLNEQKQAIIHQAVTRGLDPNVRLKPSGVEWLGDMPEHWRISRLKFAASDIVDCLHATPHYTDDGGYPAIRTADVEPGKVRLADARKVDRKEYELWTSRLKPAPEDVLYSREGERFGIAAPVPNGVQLCVSQRMMVIRIQPQQSSAFIMWQLNCPHVYTQAAADVIGAAAPHVNVERIKNYWLVIPPIAEQQRIAAHIVAATRGLDAGMEQITREIALIREYRTRLVSDAVTGKLDVRDTAACLPERDSQVQTLEAAASPTDDDEELGEPDLESALETVEA